MRKVLINLFWVLVIGAIVYSLYHSLNLAVTGQPLTFWDVAVLAALPSGFFCALIACVCKVGWRFAAVVVAVQAALAACFYGCIVTSFLLHSPMYLTVSCDVFIGIIAGTFGFRKSINSTNSDAITDKQDSGVS